MISKEEKIRIFGRVVVLLLIPFFIGAFLIPHQEIVTSNTALTQSQNGSNGNSGKLQYNFTQNDESTLPSKINTIFPVADYLNFWPFIRHTNLKVCFADNQSYLTNQNNLTIKPDFNWTVIMNNNETVRVPSGGVGCSNIEFSKKFSYRWNAEIPLNLTNASVDSFEFTPKTSAYMEWTVDYGVMQGLSFIPASYLFIWYPLIGIMKKIRKGIMEQ